MYRFGSREICDVVFKAKTNMQLGALSLGAMQPALYIDTATASTLEQATTTVYAQGGKGNTRLITWEGEKTLTFTITDALLSPVGIAILTGAGILTPDDSTYSGKTVHVHATYTGVIEKASTGDGKVINLPTAADTTAPVFVMDYTNEVIGAQLGLDQTASSNSTAATISGKIITLASDVGKVGQQVFVDYYELHKASKVSEIQIDSSCFSGNFYVEASTLFRNTDGKDLPCEITIPNAKIQSNITISMSASGDPSTFDFTMDAMPGYTVFDKTKKVMCVLQVVDDISTENSSTATVFGHTPTGGTITGGDDTTSTDSINDSIKSNGANDDDVETLG